MELHSDKNSTKAETLFSEISIPVTSRDSVVERQIPWPFGDTTTSDLLYATWALIIGGYTDSNPVTFDVPFPETVPFAGNGAPALNVEATVSMHVAFSEGQLVGEYLKSIQMQTLELFSSFAGPGARHGQTGYNDTLPANKLTTLVEVQSHKRDQEHMHHKEYAIWHRWYAIVLHILPEGEKMSLRAIYNPVQVELSVVERLLEQFQLVVSQLGHAESGQNLYELTNMTTKHIRTDNTNKQAISRDTNGLQDDIPSLNILHTSNTTSLLRHVPTEDHDLAGDYWRAVFEDDGFTTFPLLPPSVHKPLATGTEVHEFSWLENGSTDIAPSILLRAAWAFVSSSVASSKDVVFGVAVPGRNALANNVDETSYPTVPLRIRLASGQLVSEYLQMVKQQAAEMTPFERIGLDAIAKINPGARQACLFQTLLVLQYGDESVSLDLLNSCALVLNVEFDVNSVRIRANFDTGVIEADLVLTLLYRLASVTQQLAGASPNFQLGDIRGATLLELDQIWSWNNTVPPNIEGCVHELIEQRALSQPDALAVSAWDGSLTYAQLDKLASQLCHHLIVTSGVVPQTIVPLCFEKSMWTTVAMLGVLKAGAAFVLLEPSLPLERLTAIVSQVDATIILSSALNTSLASLLVGNTVVVEAEFFQQPSLPPSVKAPYSPSSIMYVVFTSGSTGVPKGVMVSHQNFVSALHHQTDCLGFNSSTRAFDFTSYSFDIYISNALMTLAAGGCLCVPSNADRQNRLTDSLLSSRSTIAHLGPSVARLLEEAAHTSDSLQTIILAGEAVRLGDAKPWWGKVRIINAYGPSECTPVSTINHSASSPEEVASIGRGVGLVTWIVDADNHNSLLPPGCIGELLLEGPLVGLGYLKNTTATTAAFIEDPPWLIDGTPGRPGRRGRLYKTGDLVKYNADGSLMFIGRKDVQVKIHGQRVELGEVEGRLQEIMPNTRQIVAEVISSSTENSAALLAAFILQDPATMSDPDPDPEADIPTIISVPPDVTEYLARHLPSYMIPTVLFSVKNMPMTATGKIDRRSLRALGESFSTRQLAEIRTASDGPKRQPTTELEQTIRDIWAQVLELPPASVGLDDKFVQLGGDSIAAMKAVAIAYKAGVQLAVGDIFTYATLGAVAREAKSVAETSPLVPSQFSLLGADLEASSFVTALSARLDLHSTLIEDAYPCTPLQAGLISLTSKQPGGYIMRSVQTLPPNFSVNVFRRAWESVVRDLPILRTRLVQHELGILQVVLHEEIDWVETGDLETYLHNDKKQPMMLGERLTRYALIKTEDGKYEHFVWTVHHALYDGWSLPLIYDAVSRAYRGEAITEPRSQFSTFIQYLGEQDEKKSNDYWRDALGDGGFSMFPVLPSSVKSPVADGVATHHIPWQDTTIMRNATISNLIRAAWAIVSGEMVNSQDVVFGVTVSGRSAPVSGIDEMVGPTLATVPVRIAFTKDQTISDYLSNIQSQSNTMIPFEQTGLQKISKMGSGAQQACLFQTLLVLQPEPVADDDLLSWLSDIQQQALIDTYALLLEIDLGANNIKATARYDSRVLEPWLVQGLLQRLENVMLQLAKSNSTQTVASIDVMTSQELDVIWRRNSAVPATVEQCVDEIVHERALLQPDSPAVCAWDGELSFAQLDELAARVAHHLVSMGVGVGVVVPLCFEKSMWATVAMLGVLKAGGCFMMLEPSFPEERLQAMIQQVDAKLILSSSAQQKLGLRLVRNVFVIDEKLRKETTVVDIDQPVLPRSASSTMYMVFTSGSTGIPKGVMVTHQSFASALYHQTGALSLTPKSRVFEFPSYAFDAAILNTFFALSSGGCLCTPSEDDRKSRLSESIVLLRANTAFFTPSVSRLISPADVPELRSIFLGGEALRAEDVARWWGKAEIVNGYGPSECTPFSVINSRASSPIETVRIGKGHGVVTWVVDPDDHNRLVSPGCIGELLLEGPLVGPGYINDPLRNSTVFLENPQWLVQGTPTWAGRLGRLYKTGDLVVYEGDGSLTFMGRKDVQVKIRGQRVELEEVEYWLKQLMPDTKHVVAEIIVPEGKDAAPELAAFLQVDRIGMESLSDTEALSVSILDNGNELADRLADHLPSYMVPNIFFNMSYLPMTTTGKIDHRQLRAAAAAFSAQDLAEMRTARQGLKRLPTTQLEAEMQTIWARVLNLKPDMIGLDDSFLQLGGDSITAMQISSTARSSSIYISTADILRKKTIAALFQSMSMSHEGISIPEASTSQIKWQPGKPLTLSPIQRLYVHLQPDLEHCCFDQTFLLALNKNIDGVSLSQALHTIIRRHAILRARFIRDADGSWQHHISDDIEGSFSVTISDKSDAQASDIIARCRENLNIEQGPLVATVLFDNGKQQSLFLTIHHLVIDLVSWRIILQELEQYLATGSIEVPLTLDFPSWVSLQAQHATASLNPLDSIPFAVQPSLLDYWGMDNSSANTYGETTSCSFTLDERVSSLLLGCCNDAFGTRPLELLLGSFIHAFSEEFPDRTLPLFFTEGHGREPWDNAIDVSGTVGWFTSMFPIQLASNIQRNTVLDAIRETKDTMRSVPNNGWSYFTSRFADEQAAKEHVSMFPVEILFNYTGQYQQLERDDALFKRIDLPTGCEPASYHNTRRFSVIEVSVEVDKGCIEASIVYPLAIRHQDAIIRWISEYQKILVSIAESLPRAVSRWTLSDFPLAFPSYDSLDEFQDGEWLSRAGIRPDDVEDIIPCSPIQEGILASQSKDPSVYRPWSLLEVNAGPNEQRLDIERLKSAWGTVVKRHGLLRAVLIDNVPGRNKMLQVILRDPSPGITLLRPGHQLTAMDSKEDSRVPYGPHGIQHHLTICELDDKRAYIWFDANHVILDGFSQKILWDDLQAAYRGDLIYSSPAGAYRGFVEYLAQQPLEAAMDFWAGRLSTIEPCFFPTIATYSYDAESVWYADVTGIDIVALRLFCSKWEITPATIIQVAWALILSKYSGTNTPCFGTLYSGRDVPIKDSDQIFGPLIAMVPSRITLDPSQNVAQTLRQAQDDYLRCLPYQHTPLVSIHKAQGLDSSALFNTGVSFQRTGDVNADSDDNVLSIHPINWDDPTEVCSLISTG